MIAAIFKLLIYFILLYIIPIIVSGYVGRARRKRIWFHCVNEDMVKREVNAELMSGRVKWKRKT